MKQKLHLLIREIIQYSIFLIGFQFCFQWLFIRDTTFYTVSLSLFNTIQFGIISGVLFGLPIWIHAPSGKIIARVFFTISFLLQYLLSEYLHQTGILLGADLLAYKFSDLLLTVSSSSEVNYGPLGLFILLLAGYYLLIFKARAINKELSNWIVYGFAGVLLISIVFPSSILFGKTSNKYLVVNPSYYFFNKVAGNWVGTSNSAVPDFPFLTDLPNHSIFTDHLNTNNTPPSIVIIGVEGLGAQLVTDGEFSGATPFLDSLAAQSLYWKNCLSNTGRTFGILPTLLGSLPYGSTGFMDLGAEMPPHYTLFSLLKSKYKTAFYYGGNANFDNQDLFLEYQKTDLILDEAQFGESFSALAPKKNEASWGYPDKALFEFGLSQLPIDQNQPHLSFFMTLSSHEPFIVPDSNYFQKAEKLMNNKAIFSDFPNVFACVAYTDDAIKSFFKGYQQRADFANTIFIITGDHRLIPLPENSPLDRYRVPFMVYSPLLKAPVKSEDIITHSQVAPSLLSYMTENYGFQFPEQLSFISQPIENQNVPEAALMRNKNELSDYIAGNYFLSENQVFKIDVNMNLTAIENEMLRDSLENKLNYFKAANTKSISEKQLVIDGSGNFGIKQFTFTEKEKSQLERLHISEFSPDSIYFLARELGINQDFEKARLLLKYGLNHSPNYHDMRILYARTFAWEEQFDSAYVYLDEAYHRNQQIEDLYIAYADVAFWGSDTVRSDQWISSGLKVFPKSEELQARKARMLITKNHIPQADSILQGIISRTPNHQLSLTLLQRIQALKNQE